MKTPIVLLCILASVLFLIPLARANDMATETNPLAHYERRVLNASLRTAARRDDLDNLKGILKKGADVDGASRDGMTALMYAASGCHAQIVYFLIQAGANVNMANRAGRTPLILAVRSQSMSIVRMMLRHPSLNLLHKDASGKNAEDYALSATELEVDGPTFKLLHLLRAATRKAAAAAKGLIGRNPGAAD